MSRFYFYIYRRMKNYNQFILEKISVCESVKSTDLKIGYVYCFPDIDIKGMYGLINAGFFSDCNDNIAESSTGQINSFLYLGNVDLSPFFYDFSKQSFVNGSFGANIESFKHYLLKTSDIITVEDFLKSNSQFIYSFLKACENFMIRLQKIITTQIFGTGVTFKSKRRVFKAILLVKNMLERVKNNEKFKEKFKEYFDAIDLGLL